MNKGRIIIVEDSKFQGAITRDILKSNGYEAELVFSSEEAMLGDKYKDFDLILLDVILPGINGYDFCKIIKKEMPLIPVIMLTSLEEEKNVVSALNSGADDYIKKPYSVNELLARVEVQLRTKGLQIELQNKNIELQRAYETIKDMASRDILTGAYNRVFLKDYINGKIDDIVENSEKSLVCFMIDIDHFKIVNDTYGHLTGDIVLENVSKICRDCIGNNGAVIRFGGEEFLIVMDSNTSRAIECGETIRKKCEECQCCGFKFTISIGIKSFLMRKETGGDDFHLGIKGADEMLYISKNSGRNKVTASM
jgi:diguanylate cyclase (GGDEF)-like protein